MSTLEEAIEVIKSQATADLRTILPGRVESYAKDDQRAAVKPVVNAQFIDPDTGDLESKPFPVIPNVPVAFPSASNFTMSWPLETGDTVLVLWAERAVDRWLETGEVSDPVENRRHDDSDAIALPMMRPFSDAIDEVSDTDVVLGLESGTEVHIGKADPAQYVALADDTRKELNDRSQRTTNHLGIYNSHTHMQILPLIPIAPSPTTPPNTQDTAPVPQTGPKEIESKKLKSE